ncbi:helix-turn-helix transcriptional regulator [Paenibacillus sp. PR3]|uniref:Helix-turn-helix transcriptional regulator n=1 Tax=Paenibacillus terricola TaxID=2763503 RepID=A0ABR8N0M2_9BACL|nr:AraC family transcriptional regulator [Paenibacillus terricola]MBD3921748.1 helix-turn-helix transcriptional regulator [Paenibacillus terricola]
MSLLAHGLIHTPLHFAYKRKSVNYEHKETFHSHLGIEILYIHQGRGTMIVNNNSYAIKPGMLCIFQPYQLHHLQLEYDDNQCFERSLAIFEPTMFDAHFEPWPALHAFYNYINVGKLPYPCLYELDDTGMLDQLFRNMHELIPTLSESDKREEISLFLVGLFRAIKQAWGKQSEQPTADHGRRRNYQVEHILSWIEANYKQPFRLDDMAGALHLSSYHLSHLFKEATGVSITEYLITRRIHQAVLLLTTTNKPISWIAEEIGLTNNSYFCKLFKTHMGITPHQYRKKWA